MRVVGYEGAENTYDLTVEVAGCDEGPADDRFEENDELGTAASVEPGHYPGLILLEGDEDWFRVEICGGGQLTVRIVFIDADGDLDLGIHDITGRLFATSDSSTDGAEASAHAPDEGGIANVRVWGYDGAGNTYDLSIDVSECGGG